jgi:hypothetical protein
MASTHYESGDLILKLFELRREAKLRESRDWWMAFKPKSIADLKKAGEGSDRGKFAMAMGYWEMAASLVNHGAIDEKMFNDANFEHVMMFSKIQPYLVEVRAEQPWFFTHVEKLVMKMPNANAMLDDIRKKWG